MAFYAFLADLIVTVHLCYVLFAVGGEAAILAGAIFRWAFIRQPAFRIAHLAAVGLVAAEAALRLVCPLTEWEYNLRQLAGQTVERKISFVARLARLIVFHDLSPHFLMVLHVGFGVLVVLTFIFIPPRFAGKKRGQRPGVF